MSYATELAALQRTKIDLIVIKCGYCSNTYGSSPCTASGSDKCYNTYPTCQDTANYGSTTREYKFTNYDKPHIIYDARPYIKTIDDIPTEIQEKNTVVKRLKVTMIDEPDRDYVIDPYRSDRADSAGYFWRKFVARNANYKGRIIELYEGFTTIAEGDFELKFVGKLENIKINNNNGVTIEAVDLLKGMGEITYPFKTGCALTQALPMVHVAESEDAMLNLNASQGDYCVVKKFLDVSVTTEKAVSAIGGALTPNDYKYYIVAIGTYGQILGISPETNVTVTSSENAVELEWSAVSGASGYRVYKFKSGSWNQYVEEASEYYLDLDNGTDEIGEIPTEAKRYFEMTGTDPKLSASWATYSDEFSVTVSNTSELSPSGYLRIEKELIYYSGIVSSTLKNIVRGVLNTEIVRHDIDTSIEQYGEFTLDNPFTHLQDLLTLAGIDSAYIDDSFTTYETSWSSVYFALTPIFKDIKLSDLFYDLVNSVDCLCWVNEDGKIEIRYHSDLPASYTILTDEQSFILNSLSVDYNEKSRKTRWVLYWNRYDTESGLQDKEGYNRTNIVVDSVAEGAEYYNTISEDVQYSSWINVSSSYNGVNVTDYISDPSTGLLFKRKARTNKAQAILSASCEMKDDGVKVGDIVKISTAKLQDIYGNDYSEVKFRVVKKEKQGSKINFKFIEII